MNADEILDQIDATLADHTVSSDAMRSRPEAPRPSAELRRDARQYLISQLVDHHGLTRMSARAAVAAVEQGRTDGPYSHLVHAEARAALTETAAQLRCAMRPFIEAVAASLNQLHRAIAAAAQSRADDFVLSPPADD